MKSTTKREAMKLVRAIDLMLKRAPPGAEYVALLNIKLRVLLDYLNNRPRSFKTH